MLSVSNTEAAAGSCAPQSFFAHPLVPQLGASACSRQRLNGGREKIDAHWINCLTIFFLKLQLSQCLKIASLQSDCLYTITLKIVLFDCFTRRKASYSFYPRKMEEHFFEAPRGNLKPFLSCSFFFYIRHILPEFLSKEEKQLMALLLGGKLQSEINPVHLHSSCNAAFWRPHIP